MKMLLIHVDLIDFPTATAVDKFSCQCCCVTCSVDASVWCRQWYVVYAVSQKKTVSILTLANVDIFS